MNQGSPHTEINQAFCERPDLQKRVYSALGTKKFLYSLHTPFHHLFALGCGSAYMRLPWLSRDAKEERNDMCRFWNHSSVL